MTPTRFRMSHEAEAWPAAAMTVTRSGEASTLVTHRLAPVECESRLFSIGSLLAYGAVDMARSIAAGKASARDIALAQFFLVTSAAACASDTASGSAGFEGGPCIDGECFDDLMCLSEICVESGASGQVGSSGQQGPSEGPGATSDVDTGPAKGDSTTSDGDGHASSPGVSDSENPASSGPAETSGPTSGGSVESTTTSTDSGHDSRDDSAVAYCGNGVVDTGEQCEGEQLQGWDCAALGLGGGELRCDPITCTFDTSMCGTITGGTDR